jgi:hypothetical protein
MVGVSGAVRGIANYRGYYGDATGRSYMLFGWYTQTENFDRFE